MPFDLDILGGFLSCVKSLRLSGLELVVVVVVRRVV